MGNALFDGGRNAFLNGSVDWVNDTINGVLVDLDDISGTITDASNATPIVITQTAHGLQTATGSIFMGSSAIPTPMACFVSPPLMLIPTPWMTPPAMPHTSQEANHSI